MGIHTLISGEGLIPLCHPQQFLAQVGGYLTALISSTPILALEHLVPMKNNQHYRRLHLSADTSRKNMT